MGRIVLLMTFALVAGSGGCATHVQPGQRAVVLTGSSPRRSTVCGVGWQNRSERVSGFTLDERRVALQIARRIHDALGVESGAIENAILRHLKDAEAGKPVELDCVSIVDIELDPSAARDAAGERAAVETARAAIRDADIERVRAEADADAILIRARAVAEAILLVAAARTRAAATADAESGRTASALDELSTERWIPALRRELPPSSGQAGLRP